MTLQGKSALITGGSRGIGKEIARVFLREGAEVMLVARSADELRRTKNELAAIGDNVEICSADISRITDVQHVISATIKAFGKIDILVNAAGVYGPIGLSETVDFEAWKQTFAINVFGTFAMVQKVLPIMKSQKRGKIINFSGGGDGPLPRFTAYSASKISIVRLTESLAAEVKDDGIEINVIAPGAVNTTFLDEALAAGEEAVGKERYQALLTQKESGGVSPEKAAELCAYLASERSNGLSGKLVSAVWDDWQQWDPAEIKSIMSGNRLNMRRINT